MLSLGAGVCASAFLAACMSESTEPQVDEVTIPVGDIPEPGDDPYHSEEGRFFLMNDEDGLLAIFAKCTHQGCLVGWRDEDDGFHCPCHDSHFNRYGERTEGPAPRPLDLMRLEPQSDGGVRVVTDDITTRDRWEPSQSVKT